MNDIIELLTNGCDTFKENGTFTPGDIRAVCAKAGIAPKFNLLAKSTKLERGVYQYGGAAQLKVVPKTKKEPVTDKAYSVVESVQSSSRESVQRNSTFAHVPAVDNDYVPFGDYRDIEKIVKSKAFYPVLITGHSGNGKTMTIEQACAKFDRPMIRINCTKKTDEEVLIGSKTLIDGSVQIVEGPMLTAMRSGAVLLLDELTCSDPGAIMCIQGILEGKPYYFPLSGEYITPAKGFNVFMTDNTKGQGSEDGRYIGTNILNEAFLERIGVTIEQDYPSASVEKKIVLARMATKECVNEKFADNLVKWASSIRRAFADGGIDSVISTRRLAHIIDNYSIFNDESKAIRQCTNRFDEMTKNAFVTLWDKISDGIEDLSAQPIQVNEI